MMHIISGLSIPRRFFIISLITVIMFLMTGFMVWNVSGQYEALQQKNQRMNDFENKLLRMRINYNGVKADMMTMLISHPVMQKQYIAEAEQMFKERVAELQRDLSETDDIARLPEKVATDVKLFYSNVDRYLSFFNTNLKMLQDVSPDDSVNFAKARMLMVEDLATYYNPLRKSIITALDALHAYQKEMIKENQASLVTGFWTHALIYIILLTVVWLLLRVIATSIIRPVITVQQTLEELSAGKLPVIEASSGKDELSAMLGSMGLLNTHLHRLVDFAGNVAKNNFAVAATMFDGNGPIALALVNMRDHLKTAHVDDQLRIWTSKGLSTLSEISRAEHTDKNQAALALVKFLTTYVHAQQGGLFVAMNDEREGITLQLMSCYAYERKKFLKKMIRPGEGLIGQTYLEGETMLMTEVPDDYVNITSGLGTANPGFIAIIPMKNREKVIALFEVASFKLLDKYQIDFLEKAGEIIASSIVTANSNEHMEQLLKAAQQQAEELKAQEEEVRQNMEELLATQEEMLRKQTENENRIKAINESGIASIEFDLQGNIIDANDSFQKLMGYSLHEIQGKHHSIFVSPEFSNSAEYEKFWEDLRNGIPKPGEYLRITRSGKKIYIKGSYSIMRDQAGRPVRILKLAFDITQMKSKE